MCPTPLHCVQPSTFPAASEKWRKLIGPNVRLWSKAALTPRNATSVVTPATDIGRPRRHVGFVPIGGRDPHHSITLSAAVSKVGGTVRPSALAALRLMTSSKLVGCWIGKSAGFV